jgi:hypothetical protein
MGGVLLMTFEPNPDERTMLKKRLLNADGSIRDDVKVLYACDSGCVVERGPVRASIWKSGRVLVEVREKRS